jgi:hypothetical protein
LAVGDTVTFITPTAGYEHGTFTITTLTDGGLRARIADTNGEDLGWAVDTRALAPHIDIRHPVGKYTVHLHTTGAAGNPVYQVKVLDRWGARVKVGDGSTDLAISYATKAEARRTARAITIGLMLGRPAAEVAELVLGWAA